MNLNRGVRSAGSVSRRARWQDEITDPAFLVPVAPGRRKPVRPDGLKRNGTARPGGDTALGLEVTTKCEF